MPRKPRNRTDDSKRRGSVGSPQKESAIDAGGVSGAAPTAERRPTEPVSTSNPLPEAQKRARNAGEEQQSAKRTTREEGERVGIRDATQGKSRRPEIRRTRDGFSEKPNERQSSNDRKQNDWRGDAAMASTSQVPPRKFDLMTASGLSDEARQAVNAAFDAMSDWRTEAAESNERYLTKVIDKMAAAAGA
jgi:hypothetical protein